MNRAGYRSGGGREGRDCRSPRCFHGNGWQMVYTAPMNGHKLVLPGRNFEPDTSSYELMADEQVDAGRGRCRRLWLTLLDYMEGKGLRFRIAAGGDGWPAPSRRRALIEAIEGRHGVRGGAVLGHDRGAGGRQGDPAAGVWPRRPAAGKDRAQAAPRAAIGLRHRAAHRRRRRGEVLPRGRRRPSATWQARRPCHRGGLPEAGEAAWRLAADRRHGAHPFPNGCVDIVDRSKDVIKSGGEWISSVAIEGAALDHPGIAQAAVIAMAPSRAGRSGRC